MTFGPTFDLPGGEVIGFASEKSDETVHYGFTAPLPYLIKNAGIKINNAKSLLDVVLKKRVSKNNHRVNNLDNAINSTALVLINKNEIQFDFKRQNQSKMVLIEVSVYRSLYYLDYTIIEFNPKGPENKIGENTLSGCIGIDYYSNASDIIDILYNEINI